MHGVNNETHTKKNCKKKSIKKPIWWVSNRNTIQILVFGGYLKVRGFLYNVVVIWVNTILNHNVTKVSLLRLNVLHDI